MNPLASSLLTKYSSLIPITLLLLIACTGTEKQPFPIAKQLNITQLETITDLPIPEEVQSKHIMATVLASLNLTEARNIQTQQKRRLASNGKTQLIIEVYDVIPAAKPLTEPLIVQPQARYSRFTFQAINDTNWRLLSIQQAIKCANPINKFTIESCSKNSP